MLALCVLSGAAAQRLFLPSAQVQPLSGQRTSSAYRSPGAYMHMPSERMAGAERMEAYPGAAAAPAMETAQGPTMPAAWALTGAFIVGLGATALAVTGQRSSPAGQRGSVSMGLAVGDKFPASALSKCGVQGENAVVFFYGADDAPSCSKEISAFEAAAQDFKDAGVTVVGVRNPAGAKGGSETVKLVVDDGDAMRNEVGIEKDFFILGGRETYVLDASGTVTSVHNNQFDPDSHIKVALDAAAQLPKTTSE